MLAEICAELAEAEPCPVRVVVADAFPTGHLGYWARWLAEAGLVAALTASSPARLPHPEGGEPLVGTTPLAIGLPNPEGEPIVVDVSMGAVTYGDVLRGAARPEELVPFGGEQAHKAFALAVGLEGFISSFVGRQARDRARGREARVLPLRPGAPGAGRRPQASGRFLVVGSGKPRLGADRVEVGVGLRGGAGLRG